MRIPGVENTRNSVIGSGFPTRRIRVMVIDVESPAGRRVHRLNLRRFVPFGMTVRQRVAGAAGATHRGSKAGIVIRIHAHISAIDTGRSICIRAGIDALRWNGQVPVITAFPEAVFLLREKNRIRRTPKGGQRNAFHELRRVGRLAENKRVHRVTIFLS